VREAVNIGLVGAGPWGQRYIDTISRIDDINLAVVASRNPRTRERILESCKMLADWRSAIDNGELDGLIVATPPASHYEITRACIEAGLPVLVEKPFTLDLAEARDLEKTAGEQHSLVMINHTHLFGSAYETLKMQVQDLPHPLNVTAQAGNYGPFREDVDALWDYAPHDLSMCLDLVDEEVVSLQAAHNSSELSASAEQGMLVDIHLEFADGSQAEVTVGNLMAEKKRLLSVSAGKAVLTYDDLASDKLVAWDGQGSLSPLSLSPVLPLTRALIAFRDAIATDTKEHASLRLGVRVVEILEQITSLLADIPRPVDNAVSL
jgi:predicted dehydrogenase